MTTRQRSSRTAVFNHCKKFGSAALGVDKCRVLLKSLRWVFMCVLLFVLFLYYYVEVFFLPWLHITSYPPGSFLPTPQAELVDKSGVLPPQGGYIGLTNPGIPSRRVHHPVIAILDRDGDKALLFQCPDVGANLALADSEKIGKMAIGSVAAFFIVEGMDFHEQDFFHKRKLLGTPYFLGNPDPFEVAWEFLHPPDSTMPALFLTKAPKLGMWLPVR